MGTPATFRGTVQPDPAVVAAAFSGTVAGFVAPGFVGGGFVQAAPPTFTGTVDRTRIDAYDAELTYVGVRVVLDGVEIPARDLVGGVTLRQSIDTHLTSATVRLAGESYSIHRTERTWTRTPVQIYFRQRQAGGTAQEELRLDGLVRTCQEDDHEGEPVLELQAGDLTVFHDRYRPCYESPPYTGLTRGDYVREVCAGAGIDVDVPDGAVYNAPVQIDGPRLFDWLWQWGEPEGWHWRWEGSTLTAYVPALKDAPQVPDHVWGPREIETLRSEPPQDVPSRWAVSGYAALYVDEIGIETDLTRTRVEALYAPKVAVEEQQPDGTRTPTGFTTQDALRTILLLIETRKRRGTLELEAATEEWGWHNPARAKLVRVSGAGATGDGYNWVQSYIDEDGRFVVYHRERFGVVGRRYSIPKYDADQQLRERWDDTHSWHRRTTGVQQTPPESGGANVGALVGDDDVSYSALAPDGTPTPASGTRIEGFGLSHRAITKFHYHATGAAYREIQEEYEHYSPRASLDVAGNFYRYDGIAQQGPANFIHVRTRDRNQFLTADGRLLGLVDIAYGYKALSKLDGDHNFGGAEASNESSEQFRLVERKNVQYNVIGHNQVEEVTYDGQGRRNSRIILGPLPTPRFLSSPWTRLVQEPLELIIDDPVLEAWFGVSAESITNEYIQSQDEALAVYRARRRRAVARKLQITRAETLVRPGDTVLVLWPPLIHERYLLTEADPTRDPIQGEASATYRLEAPL